MTRRWPLDLDRGPVLPGATAISRGPEHRIAALSLAVMLVGAGLLGTVNLFVSGMLHGGPVPWIYGGTMALVISAVGVLLFAGLTAYDTQRIKSEYFHLRGSDFIGKAAIMGALNLYLDFVNMFSFLLNFMGQRD